MPDCPMSLEEFRRGAFESRTTNPAHWQGSAQLMYRASRVLFERQAAAWTESTSGNWDGMPWAEVGWTFVEEELFRPALLLTGYAVELLLKAGGLKRGVDIEKLINKSHGLSELADMAGFKPDAEESQLLDLLQRAIVWSGRYPVPKKVESFDPGRIEDSAGSHVAELARETEALYEAIRSAVHRG